jgi:hypothetical protein
MAKITRGCKFYKDGACDRGFKDYTFEELTDWIRGQLIVSLGKGTFKADVPFYCEIVARWHSAQKK